MPIRFILMIALIFLTAACQWLGGNDVFDGPLSQHEDNDIWKFDQYPAMKTNGSDALRIIIQPSFGLYSYRFDFVPMRQNCYVFDREIDDFGADNDKFCGHILVEGLRWSESRSGDSKRTAEMLDFRFVVPSAEFDDLFNATNYRLAHWRGEYSSTTDGTSIAIEQHRRGLIMSFRSNAWVSDSIDDPAANAGLAVHRLALSYGPAGIFPKERSWNYFDDSESLHGFPCANPGLNQPDADGFGIGDDECAEFLAKQK